jgi:GNAT superfamily N-acetyltransferase
MIRCCNPEDFEVIYTVINDGAAAYEGVIPPDCWHEPYMSRAELRSEIDQGVHFWGYEADGALVAVMGIQDVQDVTLIRHAYVRTERQRQGIGAALLGFLRRQTNRPILIGTWSAAEWAVRFYEKHGFRRVPQEEKERLLRTYWRIPRRQIESSVVLAEACWLQEMMDTGRV